MMNASERGRVTVAAVWPRKIRCCVAAFLAILALARTAQAQANLTWDANGAAAGTGGTGTWDTASLIWFDGAVFQAWDNATFDNGIFGGTVGTVTVGAPVNVHNLTFSLNGYAVTGNTLTLGGVTPTITVSAGMTTISSTVAGTAGLTKAGASTLTLTGANTYSGGTTINAGTLQVGNGGTTGQLGTGAVVVAAPTATLQINRSDALTLADDISGTGRLTLAGGGTTILNGANSYSGVTTILGGATTLQVGTGGTTGSLGTGNVSNGGALTFDRSDAITYAGVISGTGRLTQSGAGTTILTGNNTNAGVTTISAGTLQVGAGGGSGALGAGAIVNNSALVISRGNTLTMANVISGTGTLTIEGTGTRRLTGANTYSGVTTISAGTLQIGNNGTTGTLGSGAVVNNATLAFNRTNALTVANDISGTGALTQAGTGTTTLTGNNSYSGVTTISAGTLQVGNGGTSGTLGSGALVNNATLVVNRSDALTVTGDISGTGVLTQAGTGTTTLTGTNSYSGLTTISAGTLQVGNGGMTGTLGTGAVVNNGTLTFNRSDDALTVTSDIGGTGALVQLGTGTTTLIGTNSHTGGTTISAGTLQIGNGGTTGSLSGNVIDNGVLAFNRSDAITVANEISGTGALTQAGTGTTILTGVNSYTGGTTISAGTLQIGNGGTAGTLGAGAVVNNATLAFNRSDAITVVNDISGSGALSHVGTGTTTLTGTNTYTGSTTVSVGMLQVGNGGTTGTLGTGAVVNNGTLTFNRSDDALTVMGNISGTGALVQLGTGTTSLIGTNNYIGGTTISAGTLQIGDGGTSGTIAGDVTNNATVAFNRSDAVIFGGVISGPGRLNQVGTGTTILTGTNTYTGRTTISAGTLQIGNGGTTGSLGTGPLVNNGVLAFNRSDAFTFDGAIRGTGAIKQRGTGRTILTGTNTYAGSTTISAGTLQIGNGGTAGTLGAGAVVNNATLDFNRSDALTVANNISGSGALRQVGAGTTTLTGTNTYTGSTTVSAGTVQVGNGGTSGTLGTGAVVNNGRLTFNRSDHTLTVTGDISGTGTVTQLGTGTTKLTGTNTYTSGTTISAGTLQIGNGGTSGTLVGNVTNNAVLAFDRSDNLDFGGAISGMGALTKNGAGALTLSGTNTYSGATSLKAGGLVVNGTLGRTLVSVDGGATLGGIGTITGSVNIASGGRLGPEAAPATPIARFGTLTIVGDLKLDSGSQYGVNVEASGHNSFLLVGGSAAIDSAVVAVDALPGNYGRVTRYAVLQADGGLAGTAAATTSAATLEPWLTQTHTTLFMTLLRTDLPLGSYATTPNGTAIGSVFDRLRRDATGDLARVTRELTALDDVMLAAALKAVSGEVYASSIQLAALDGEASMDLVRNEIAERPDTPGERDARQLPLTPTPSPRANRRHWWARLHAQQATFDGTPSVSGADAALRGFALGADRTFMDKWLMGIGAWYTTGRMSLDGIAESSDFTVPRAFGYLGYIKDRWATHVGASVARTSYETQRAVRFAAWSPVGEDLLFGGVDRQATAHVSGLATDIWAEERFNATIGSWSFSPRVGLRHARYRRYAWAETGADALSLVAPDQTFSSHQADAGLSFNRTTGRLRPLASAMYRRELTDRQTAATLGLSRRTEGTFVVSGLPLARNTVVGRAGLTLRTGSGDFSLIYEWRGARAQMRQAIQFSLGFE